MALAPDEEGSHPPGRKKFRLAPGWVALISRPLSTKGWAAALSTGVFPFVPFADIGVGGFCEAKDLQVVGG